jgi:hypothetical protein
MTGRAALAERTGVQLAALLQSGHDESIDAVAASYDTFADWVEGALDREKDELIHLLFPFFAYVFLELCRKNREAAAAFMARHKANHLDRNVRLVPSSGPCCVSPSRSLQRLQIQKLEDVLSAPSVQTAETISFYNAMAWRVNISRASLDRVEQNLVERSFVFLGKVLNEHIKISITGSAAKVWSITGRVACAAPPDHVRSGC